MLLPWSNCYLVVVLLQGEYPAIHLVRHSREGFDVLQRCVVGSNGKFRTTQVYFKIFDRFDNCEKFSAARAVALFCCVEHLAMICDYSFYLITLVILLNLTEYGTVGELTCVGIEDVVTCRRWVGKNWGCHERFLQFVKRILLSLLPNY